MLQNCSEFRSRSVQTYGHVLHNTNCRNHGQDPVVPPERNLYGHLLAGLLWERQFEEVLLELKWEKYWSGNADLFTVNKVSSYQYTWMTSKWQERSRTWLPCGRNWWNILILMNQHHFLTTCIWDALSVNASSTNILWKNTKTCSDRVFLLEQLQNYQDGGNLMQKHQHGPMTWKDTPKNAWRDIVNGKQKSRKIVQSFKSLLGSSSLKKEELESVGELSEVCSQIVVKCLYLARIGSPDMLWSVNKLARSVTKWKQACDRRLARLISYVHHTRNYRQHCHVGNAAQHCRLGLFQDSDFAGDLEDSKWTSGALLCIFGSRTLVPISWMCKKQTSVSHGSTESEIISLDAGLRMDGLPALDPWDVVI